MHQWADEANMSQELWLQETTCFVQYNSINHWQRNEQDTFVHFAFAILVSRHFTVEETSFRAVVAE